MFDFLKNKSINLVLDDLDNCMNYIIYSSPIKEDEVAQILNTIRHFITEIGNGKANEQEVQKHFMNMKTDIAFKKNLNNYKDFEYAKVYIINGFFTCVASNRLDAAKLNGEKILQFCVDNVSKEIRPLALELKNNYLRIFN